MEHTVVDEKIESPTVEKQNNDGNQGGEKHASNTGAGHSEGHNSTTSTISGHNDQDDGSSTTSSSHHHSNVPPDDDDEAPPVTHIATHVSGLGPDSPVVEHYTSFTEVPDSVYAKFSPRRKLTIVTLLSYCAFLAPISSTTVLSATPEVAAEFGTTGSVVDVSNALYLLFMGISPIVWGPLSEVWGRKVVRWKSCPLSRECYAWPAGSYGWEANDDEATGSPSSLFFFIFFYFLPSLLLLGWA